MTKEQLERPIWQMTVKEFLALNENNVEAAGNTPSTPPPPGKYAYGIRGIADVFSCSLSTANRIKKSGLIAGAITQVGRMIIVDRERALQLAGKKIGGRKECQG